MVMDKEPYLKEAMRQLDDKEVYQLLVKDMIEKVD